MNFLAKIITGGQIGAKFGIATANLDFLEKQPDLLEGVYLVKVQILDEEKFKTPLSGLLHFGTRKTFGTGFSAEIHLLDFEANIYEKRISVTVLKFLRPVLMFPNSDALFSQIERDITQAAKYFLRQRLFQIWENLPAKDLEILKKQAIQKISVHPFFVSASRIFAYAPQQGREIGFIAPLMATFPQKKWFFPKIEPKDAGIDEKSLKFFEVERYKDLRIGDYEILSPSKTRHSAIPRSDDFFLIPSLAIDKDLNRLGRGGGFYDKFIKEAHLDALTKISVIPKFAFLEKIPTESHDKKIDQVLVI